MGRLVRGTPSEGACWKGFLQAVFNDDNKGLMANEKRCHRRPPVPSDERYVDGEREA